MIGMPREKDIISFPITEKAYPHVGGLLWWRGAMYPNASQDVPNDALAKVAAFLLACGSAVQSLDQAEGMVKFAGGVSVHAALEVGEACPIVCPSG